MSEAIGETPVDDTKHGSAEEESEKDEQVESENEVKNEEKEEEEEEEEEEDEPSPKKARIGKDNTMLATAKSAKDFLGKEKIDELRSSTRAVRESKASAKRASTMVKTAREGEALLKEMGLKDENPETERRRTRSQTRGTPLPVQKTPAKQDTGKRNTRRGRPRKSGKSEAEEEKEETKSEDMNSAEEEKEASEQQNAEDGPKEEEEEEEKQETPQETKNEAEEESAD